MMKKLFLILLLFNSFIILAQEKNSTILNEVNDQSYLLLDNQLIKGEMVLSKIKSTFGNSYAYSKDFSIQVNNRLDYEIGQLKTKSDSYSLMFVHSKKTDQSSQIEFLIAFKNKNNTLKTSVLDEYRDLWMELCNEHQVSKLVSELYHKDAYYYNRGRLLQGTEAITKEYGYMKNPNYQLKLSPKHLHMVTDTIVYELGSCSGSYPLPYLLLWEKQDDGNWQILMDSNF